MIADLPSDDAALVQAPPSAAASNLPADASVWAAARRSYVEDGCSCPVVAERHGLHVRTVSRRAVAEDWRSLRAARLAVGREAEREAEADDPATGFVDELRAVEMGELLINPTGDALVRAAARMAGEAAAAGRPSETLAWLRAVREAERVADRVDRAFRGSPADSFRKIYFRSLHDDVLARLGSAAAEPAGEAWDGP